MRETSLDKGGKVMEILTNNYELILSEDFNGDVFTIKEFKECCECRMFVDTDGIGYYGIKVGELLVETNERAIPSRVLDGIIEANRTHIVWYNK